jgi:hypothetical protein
MDETHRCTKDEWQGRGSKESCVDTYLVILTFSNQQILVTWHRDSHAEQDIFLDSMLLFANVVKRENL